MTNVRIYVMGSSKFHSLAQESPSCFLVSLCLLFLIGCAGQVPPDGGPIDREPPKIISSYPANNTTQFHEQRIAIEFDKYVDRRSVQESIFISPNVGELEFEWSGREVEVRFPETLRERRTYVVNIGTDVVDLHNKNRMAQAFSLAFSTGDAIDRGAIEGQIFGAQSKDSPEGVMVFTYLLFPGAPDTLNPKTTKPDYITQTGKGGNFALRHLLLGNYRLLAVRDDYRNLLYDPETDEYGVPRSDVQLSFADTLRRDLLIRLAKEDTTAPRLTKITPQDRSHLLLEFSEAIDTASVRPENFSVRDTLEKKTLGVKIAAVNLQKPTSVALSTDSQEGEKPYRLTVSRIRDLAGNGIHQLANSLGFTGSMLPDTTRPTLVSFSIQDSVRGVELRPRFLAVFSDFMDKPSVAQALQLKDTLGKNVEYSLTWLNGTTLELQPSQLLASKNWYIASIDLARVKSLRGLSSLAALRRYRFETNDAETFSSIEGSIADRSVADTSGAIILTAENISLRESKSYSLRLDKPGKFEFTNLLGGNYLLRAYRDRNNNGVYDAGRPMPFTPSERFGVYADTLKLRARWPLEGVMLELK
jgi:hypothetical protein